MYQTRLAGATRKMTERPPFTQWLYGGTRLALKAQIAELKKLMTINFSCRKFDVPNSPRRGHPQNVEKAPVYTMVKLMHQTRPESSKRGAQKVNDH